MTKPLRQDFAGRSNIRHTWDASNVGITPAQAMPESASDVVRTEQRAEHSRSVGA